MFVYVSVSACCWFGGVISLDENQCGRNVGGACGMEDLAGWITSWCACANCNGGRVGLAVQVTSVSWTLGSRSQVTVSLRDIKILFPLVADAAAFATIGPSADVSNDDLSPGLEEGGDEEGCIRIGSNQAPKLVPQTTQACKCQGRFSIWGSAVPYCTSSYLVKKEQEHSTITKGRPRWVNWNLILRSLQCSMYTKGKFSRAFYKQ